MQWNGIVNKEVFLKSESQEVFCKKVFLEILQN